MSANVYWRPTNTTRHSLDVSTPSSFLSALRRAFDRDGPWELGNSDIPVLRGMAAACGENHFDNPYQRMIDAIENDGNPQNIIVWSEY